MALNSVLFPTLGSPTTPSFIFQFPPCSFTVHPLYTLHSFFAIRSQNFNRFSTFFAHPKILQDFPAYSFPKVLHIKIRKRFRQILFLALQNDPHFLPKYFLASFLGLWLKEMSFSDMILRHLSPSLFHNFHSMWRKLWNFRILAAYIPHPNHTITAQAGIRRKQTR